MEDRTLAPHLTLDERRILARLLHQKISIAQIAAQLGRHSELAVSALLALSSAAQKHQRQEGQRADPRSQPQRASAPQIQRRAKGKRRRRLNDACRSRKQALPQAVTFGSE